MNIVLSKLLKSLRNAFFTGLLLLVPVGVTIWVVDFLVGKMGGSTSRLFFFFLPEELFENTILSVMLDISAAFIVLVIITLLGWFSQLLVGKLVLQSLESLLTRVPFVTNVYSTVKQVVDTFRRQEKAVFQKVILVEFPRKGIYAIGFLTSEGKGEIPERTSQELLNIFLPTTPNPTSGFLLMVPKNETVELTMTVAEGMKLIISGGAVIPAYNPKSDKTELFEVINPETIPAPKPQES